MHFILQSQGYLIVLRPTTRDRHVTHFSPVTIISFIEAKLIIHQWTPLAAKSLPLVVFCDIVSFHPILEAIHQCIQCSSLLIDMPCSTELPRASQVSVSSAWCICFPANNSLPTYWDNIRMSQGLTQGLSTEYWTCRTYLFLTLLSQVLYLAT